MARRFLAGLTMETKAGGSTERRGDPKAISRAISASPGAMSLTGMGAVGQWDIDLAVRNGLERVIWIYRCTDVIAQNQARITIHQKQQRPQNRGQGKIIDNPELWRLLNFRPNTYESSFMFRYRLSVLLLLARRGAFIEIVPGKGGKGAAPAELHLLPPGRTEPIPDPKKFVGGYKITRQDGIDELPPERVIWLRLKPHPTDPYAQMTPLVAAGIEADTDFLARTFNRNFLANDGRPGSLIVVDGGPAGISDEDAALLKQRYGMGPAYAGLTTIVEAMGITAQDMSSTPRDTQWQELMATSKERLLLAFGVPESVMGNASGRCLRQSEWVRLSDGTRRRARDLVGEDFELLTSTPDGIVPVPAWATWEKTETIYRVITSHGRTLEVNGKHPLYASKSGGTPGWVATSDLTDEHFVAVPSVFPHEPSSDLSVDEAFVLGALVGDGSISSDRGHVALTTPEGEFADTFVTAVKNLGDVVTRREGRTVTEWHVKAKHDHLRDENGHCHCRTCLDRDAMNARNRRAGIGNKAVGRPVLLTGVKALIRKVGLSGTTSKTKFIPNEVFGATNEAQASFLGGLYAADGYILKNEIGLTLCNYELIKDVQELLLRLGVSSHLSSKRSVSSSLPQGGTYIGSYWHLSIADRNNILMFGKQVAVPGKQEKLDALVERKAASFTVSGWREKDLNPGLRWEHVRTVEKVGRDRTVGIAVPVEHTYLGTFWEHNTFDNADAERENFWNDTMLTHCDAIGTGLDPLTGDDNDDTILAFNYDEVDVLQRVKRTQREEWRTELSAGGITLNEYRKRNGQPEIDSPGARAYYLPNGVVVAERQDEQEEMAKLTVLGAQPVDPAAAAQQGALEGATQGAASGNRELGNMLAARIAQMGKGYVPKMLERKTQPTPEQVVIEAEVVEPVHPYEGTRNRVEGQVEGALILWDQTQSRVVSDRLGHVKCRRGTRHWDGEEVATKALDADYAADLNEWAESLAQGIEQAVGGAVRREYRREVANIKATGVLQVLDGNPYSAIAQQKAVDAILKNATGLAREAAKNQVTRIRTRIKELDQEGASLADIKSEVQSLISGRSEWRKTLSTQITTQALEAARAAAHAPVSGLYTKTWNTVGDNHVRGSHRQVNRKTIPVPDKFSVGVSKLMFPGDPTGAVEDVINCRCFLSYRIDPKRANGR